MSSGSAWSEGEKALFYVQVVDQFSNNGRSRINYSKINMPGRTTKSLTHVMNKIRAEAAAYLQSVGDGNGLQSPVASPTKGKSKKRGMKLLDHELLDDEDNEEKKHSPQKKARRLSSDDEKKTETINLAADSSDDKPPTTPLRRSSRPVKRKAVYVKDKDDDSSVILDNEDETEQGEGEVYIDEAIDGEA
ncbi:hypothetical protein GGR54DRAFT_595444 [Hypoxylon sp. NC1633]|nr:hypothetical protein GGR54DRAFT_595444 [Hypoxylon sp. NC1633]